MNKGTCSVDGCDRRNHARGYCSSHYRRWRETGNPGPATFQRRVFGSEPERFWAHVDKTDSCWLWTGALMQSGGYGHFNLARHSGTARAHVYAYEQLVGDVPAGKVLDHTCHTPACVRPDHLRPVTRKQNTENHGGKARKDSLTGVRGVTYHKQAKLYYAKVRHNGRIVYAEGFATIAEAEASAIEARNAFHTHNDLDRAS